MIGREPEPLADDELRFRRRVRHSIARLRHEDRYGLLVLLGLALVAGLVHNDRMSKAASAGRTLAILEALTGQLYLVIVIAVIVANVGRPVRGIPDTHEDGDEEG